MGSINAQMNLIDLISESHLKLRRSVSERWEQEGNEFVSQSESHLLARIAVSSCNISEVARKTGISRQAAQKTAAALERRGFLEFRHLNENKRDKFLYLTSKGRIFIEQSEKIKLRMEKDLIGKIGSDEIDTLKRILTELSH